MEQSKSREEFVDEEKWVYDSSVDVKGRRPLRASTGAWKAALFIITIEFSERLSYFGLATSLIIYLTKVLHQDLKTAAKSVNYWAGVTTMMPLVGGFLADAYIGRFSAVLISSTIYLLGLILLTMSRVVPSWKPCGPGLCDKPREVHEVIFFISMYLVSIGTGGHKPSLESFGADQFDDDHAGERMKKMSFFNWWNTGLCSGLILGVTLIVYVQDYAGWAVADIILTVTMASTIVVFCLGRPFYRYRKANGSLFTPMVQVIVAAIRKRKLNCPSNPALLNELPKTEYTQTRQLCHTKNLKFLDKAAIVNENQENGWRLSTVTRVEEVKLIVNMIPIWITSLPFGICVAQAATFFIKQGTTMNRNITNNFQIPPATMYCLSAIGMLLSVTIYEKVLVPITRRATGNERGIKILQRIGIGMIFSVTTMIVAALVERKRLSVVERDPHKNSLSMSVFWLAPQFLIIGIGDGFTLVGLQEYFYEQVPDSMRSLGIALYLSVLGVANFISSFLITIADHITEKNGKSWFGKDLNSSHLDYFYWMLAVITAANLCIYVLVAKRFSYKSVQRRGDVVVVDCYTGDGDRVGQVA